MKYLIFNCAVFLALGYLVVGGDTQNISEKVENVREEVAEKIELVVEKQVAPVSQPIPERVVKSEPKFEPKPAPKAEVVKVAPVAPPPLPKAVEVVKTQAKKVPSRIIQSSRPPVVEVAQVTPSPESIAAATPEVTLENTKDRRKQLHQMVADMEQMFAEKMIR